MSKTIFKKYNINLPTMKDAYEKKNPQIVAHFTNGSWNWYVIAGEKLENEDYLLYGLVGGNHKETGTFTLNQIEQVSAIFNPNFESVSLNDLK